MRFDLEEYILHELARLVAIPSVTGSEMPCILYLEHVLAEMGLEPHRQPVDERRCNLVVPARARPALLLTAHVDTVPDFGHPDLFTPRLEAGWLAGRGAADVKGGIVAILAAIRLALLRDTSLDHVALAFTVDEEQGGLGSEVLASSLTADAAIVMEPTQLRICICEAGSVEAEFLVTGFACHGSEFEQGTNAIEKAISLIHELDRRMRTRRYHPLLGKAGYNLMHIAGGSSALVVPDECRVRLDVRLFPRDDPEQVVSTLQQIAVMLDARMTVHDISEPFELSPEAPIAQLLSGAFEEASQTRAEFAGMKSWTDAEPLVRHGIPAVVFGPGDLAHAHTNRERVRLADVVNAARALFHAIERCPMVLAAPS